MTSAYRQSRSGRYCCDCREEAWSSCRVCGDPLCGAHLLHADSSGFCARCQARQQAASRIRGQARLRLACFALAVVGLGISAVRILEAPLEEGLFGVPIALALSLAGGYFWARATALSLAAAGRAKPSSRWRLPLGCLIAEHRRRD